MCCTLVDEFLEEDTFLGKFISSFNKRQELSGFLLSILNPMITEIENYSSGNCLNLSLYAIKDLYQNFTSQSIDLEENFNLEEYLFSNIPKIKINFSEIKFKNKDDEDSLDELDDYKNKDLDMSISPDFEDLQNISFKEGNNNNNIIDNINELDGKNIDNLDLNYLQEKMKSEENQILKGLYLYQIQQIIDDENIFSNIDLIKALNSDKFKSQIK